MAAHIRPLVLSVAPSFLRMSCFIFTHSPHLPLFAYLSLSLPRVHSVSQSNIWVFTFQCCRSLLRLWGLLGEAALYGKTRLPPLSLSHSCRWTAMSSGERLLAPVPWNNTHHGNSPRPPERGADRPLQPIALFASICFFSFICEGKNRCNFQKRKKLVLPS